MKTKKMILTALLMSLSIIIPITFGGFLRIIIPPFSATLAAHVPLFLAMFLGPFSAAIVALGSAIGFLVTSDPIIAARAFTHVGVAIIGGYMLKNKQSYSLTMLCTAPIHGILESLIVIPLGFSLSEAFIAVGIGTIIHHSVDAVIARGLLPVLKLSSPLFNENSKIKKEVSI